MKEEEMNQQKRHDRNLLEAVAQNEHELPQIPPGLNGRLMSRLENDKSVHGSYGKVWYWLTAACVAAGIIIGLWNFMSSDNDISDDQVHIAEVAQVAVDSNKVEEPVSVWDEPELESMITENTHPAKQKNIELITEDKDSVVTDLSNPDPPATAGIDEETLRFTGLGGFAGLGGFGGSSVMIGSSSYYGVLADTVADSSSSNSESMDCPVETDSLEHLKDMTGKRSEKRKIERQIKRNEKMQNKNRIKLTLMCLSALTSAQAQGNYSEFVSQYHEKWGITLSFPEKKVTYEYAGENGFLKNNINFADMRKVGNVSTFPAGAMVKLDDDCMIILEEQARDEKPRPSHYRPIDEHTIPDYESAFKYSMLNNLTLPWFHYEHDDYILNNDTLMDRIREAERKYVLARRESDALTERINCDVATIVRIPVMESLNTFEKNESLELLKSLYRECYGVDFFRADRYKAMRILVFMNSGKKTIDDYVDKISRHVKFDPNFFL